MDDRQQVKADLKVALRKAVEALTAHSFFETISTCIQCETDGPVLDPDGRWTPGRVPVRIPFARRSASGELNVPQELYTTICAVCAEHGIGDILGRWEEQVWEEKDLRHSREHESTAPQEHVDYWRFTRWGVDSFIHEYARSLDEWHFDEDVFENLYQEYEAFLGDGGYLRRIVVPLRCLECEVDETALDERTSLGRLTSDEVASWEPSLWNDLNAFCNDLNYYFGSGCVLRIQTPYDWDGGLHGQVVLSNIERFITACRLLRQPGVPKWLHWLEVRSRFENVRTCLDQNSWTRPVSLNALGKPRFNKEDSGKETTFRLTKDLLPDLLGLWQQLKANEDGKLAIALRRYNGLDDRRYLEDKLIDMAILLESALIDGKGELSFRLGLRAARLLSRASVFETLRKLYDYRSDVVHGTQPDLATAINKRDKSQGQRDGEALVTEVQGICTDVLVKLLARTQEKSLKEVLKNLDDEAIEGVPLT
ncbi:MAG: hypothetical protein HPY44_20385 [Armatimonadetes bacterium]|nr:hypothetical protein [Armatimonadota bacterium]